MANKIYSNIKYFKGLNALRFFAAYLVVMHHLEQIRLKNDMFNLKHLSLFNNGGVAVSFFFVLSGFLITYLIIKEQDNTQNLSIKKFYIRRILRIWPLYFLLVLIGTLLIPFLLKIINFPYEMPYSFKNVIWYYIFFSPFMVNLFYGHHFLEPLWSIGVEEIFYIIWAPLCKFLKKWLLPMIISVIFVKYILLIIISQFQLPPNLEKVIRILEFESMAIGGLASYIIFNNKKRIENFVLFSKTAQVIIISFILSRIFAVNYLSENYYIFKILFHTNILSSVLLRFSFAWLIVNVAINTKSILRLDNKVFNFLGNISYGIYMYHMLIVFGVILLLKKTMINLPNILSTIIFYAIVTFCVILVSYLSKILFEDYFLRLKEKFRMKSVDKNVPLNS